MRKRLVRVAGVAAVVVLLAAAQSARADNEGFNFGRALGRLIGWIFG